MEEKNDVFIQIAIIKGYRNHTPLTVNLSIQNFLALLKVLVWMHQVKVMIHFVSTFEVFPAGKLIMVSLNVLHDLEESSCRNAGNNMKDCSPDKEKLKIWQS